MKLPCPHCDSNTNITHRDQISKQVIRFYANCQNKDCSARIAYRMSVERTIMAPISDQLTMMHELFAQMDPNDRKQLISAYS